MALASGSLSVTDWGNAAVASEASNAANTVTGVKKDFLIFMVFFQAGR